MDESASAESTIESQIQKEPNGYWDQLKEKRIFQEQSLYLLLKESQKDCYLYLKHQCKLIARDEWKFYQGLNKLGFQHQTIIIKGTLTNQVLEKGRKKSTNFIEVNLSTHNQQKIG